MTIGEAIVNQLQKTPQKIIQIMESTSETLTAQEFLDYSAALARNIVEMGIKPQDIVGLYVQHSLHLGTVMMASFLAGTPVHGIFHGVDKGNDSLQLKIVQIERYYLKVKIFLILQIPL